MNKPFIIIFILGFIFVPGQLLCQELNKKEIGENNIRHLFSKKLDSDSFYYTPKENERLYDISKKFNMTRELLIEINGIENSEKIPEKLKIVPPQFSILIERGRNTLALYRNGKFFKEYTVATGRDFSTPMGKYLITSKLIRPPWIFKGKVINPKNPAYPLGTRWMGLSGTRIGIHGTKNPEHIGQYVSKGCIRMFNRDVEELFKIISFGTEVTIKE